MTWTPTTCCPYGGPWCAISAVIAPWYAARGQLTAKLTAIPARADQRHRKRAQEHRRTPSPCGLRCHTAFPQPERSRAANIPLAALLAGKLTFRGSASCAVLRPPLAFGRWPRHLISRIVVEGRPQALDRLAPQPRQDVAVGVERDADLAVPQPLLHLSWLVRISVLS